MIITFEKVERRRSKTGKCAVCGYPATRSKTFCQTINPFNKNSCGKIKTRREIYDELLAEADRWRDEPVVHARCDR